MLLTWARIVIQRGRFVKARGRDKPAMRKSTLAGKAAL